MAVHSRINEVHSFLIFDNFSQVYNSVIRLQYLLYTYATFWVISLILLSSVIGEQLAQSSMCTMPKKDFLMKNIKIIYYNYIHLA